MEQEESATSTALVSTGESLAPKLQRGPFRAARQPNTSAHICCQPLVEGTSVLFPCAG